MIYIYKYSLSHIHTYTPNTYTTQNSILTVSWAAGQCGSAAPTSGVTAPRGYRYRRRPFSASARKTPRPFPPAPIKAEERPTRPPGARAYCARKPRGAARRSPDSASGRRRGNGRSPAAAPARARSSAIALQTVAKVQSFDFLKGLKGFNSHTYDTFFQPKSSYTMLAIHDLTCSINRGHSKV